MENGKPTGPKPKWWSRPARPEPSSVTDAVATADTPDAVHDAGPGPDTVRHGAQVVAPAVPVDDQAEYPLAAPAPAPTPAPASVPDAQSQAPEPDTSVAEQQPPHPHPQSAGDGWTDPADVVPHGHDGLPAGDRTDGGVRPLHEPDEYRTPPYGGPGPWAPAPPVQRPGGGTPPPYPSGSEYAAPAPAPAPGPLAAPPAPAPVPVQWSQYDPWSSPGAALTQAGEPPRKKTRRGMAFVGALLFALLAGVLGGGVGAYLERNGGISTVELPQSGAEDSGRAPDSIAGIAASALPSVVTLHVSGSGEQGTGTGFVLDAQGHILTNNHVVDPAGSSGDISVTFSGGETARATLVGKDSGYDLAVVKVTGVSGLRPLPLGNSDNVRVGDPVVAIGAPFDLQNTVTAGIISAKERPITAGGEKGDGSDVSYVDALQTDAPINPGNSGGPLVDSKARVIGINSAIRAADSAPGPDGSAGQSGSIGLGFAIPINQGKRVAEELINTGKATHPVIGVSLDMQYSGDGARVGEKGKDGAASVTAGGPAAKAGVRPGDVITKVDGQRVHSGEELIVKIRAHRPGDRLELTITRNGKEQTKTLTLGSSTGT
ncbi:trypsin-like peptidase domain-containing protein [Streptomyces sp. NPDC055709]